MFCNNCGKELNDREKFCPNCGIAVKEENQSTAKNTNIILNDNTKKIRCPNCRGNNLHALAENNDNVTTTGGGYSASKGCLGYLIFGPFGLLCGNCGQSQKTTVTKSTKIYWICQDCGHKFRNQEDLENEKAAQIAQKKKAGKLMLVFGILELVCSIFLKIIPVDLGSMEWFSNFGIICGILFTIIGLIMLVSASSDELNESNDADSFEDINYEDFFGASDNSDDESTENKK